MLKILAVDDQPLNLEILREMLDAHSVRTAQDGSEATQVAQEFLPDLILLDVMMPGMDGPSTLRALRAEPETAHIPIIFVTAKSQRFETDSLCRLGAAGVVVKPFDPRRLSEEILSFLPGATVH
jgi:two-component system OmpR family response regulator